MFDFRCRHPPPIPHPHSLFQLFCVTYYVLTLTFLVLHTQINFIWIRVQHLNNFNPDPNGSRKNLPTKCLNKYI